jgi:2-polyprenyl-3-methyl-5-hydroxy-6-metoxy-1,4-benzoquinol methylase
VIFHILLPVQNELNVMSESLPYNGGELSLFQAAHHWKSYLRRILSPYICGRVLEVGAGIGGTTLALAELGTSWLCLEPEASLVAQIPEMLSQHPMRDQIRVCVGTLESLGEKEVFDTILYIDVLEHILDDKNEVIRAANHLMAKGRLIILSPAHQFLFSPFDVQVGHYRRYTTKSLRALTPPILQLETVRYLDSIGMVASMGNRCFLKRSMPTAAQIAVWDRYMIPVSSYFDRMLGYRLGKSIVCVWKQKPAND